MWPLSECLALAYHPPAEVDYNPSQRTFRRVFIDQLRVEINHIITTRDNRRYLDGLVLGPEFPIEVHGYNPIAIAEYLKSGRAIVIHWKDKEQGRKIFDERIDAAVQNAGRIVLEQLADYLRQAPNEKPLQGISEAVNGIRSLAGYYGSHNSESYVQLADSVWNKTKESALEIYVRDLERVATQDFDPRTTPGKFEEQRENLDSVLDRYGVSIIAPVWNLVLGISGKMYTRAAEQLFPETLEAILKENKDKPQSSLPHIIEDIQLALNYAWTGGIGIGRIREMAAQMLEAAKKNKLGDYIAGYIREGYGEKMEDIGRENKGKDTILKEMYEEMERRGKELQGRAKQLMNAYDLISYAIGQSMKYIEIGQGQIVEGGKKSRAKKRGFGRRLARELRHII